MSDVDLRRGSRAKLYVLGAVLVAPFAYLGWRIHHGHQVEDERRERYRQESLATAAEVAELEKLVPELGQRLDELAGQIKADVTREAIDAALASDGGRCPYDVVRELHLRDDLGKRLAMTHHESPIATSRRCR
jgi:hypothetical protein